MNPLAPFRPSASRPFGRVTAAHLLRRAGFAPTEREVRAAVSAGLDAVVKRLVHDPRDGERHGDLDALGARIARGNNIARLRGWWLLRMRHTRRPLHARMALFWHDHFATSFAKVKRTDLMLAQLRTIETHGLGRFEDLLLAMSKDPAMIVWLDGDLNVKGRPNENYARELFELFALGVGNYAEADIREAARAFTGWHQRKGRFRFAARSHDPGEKSVLGRRGPWNGDDVVKIALARPAASRFLARKLAREFVEPDPSDALVEALAARLRETGFHLGETLETLLQSEAMFAPAAYRARIKSPVEYVIGLARSFEIRAGAEVLAKATAQMGQRLFEPPSVKGWDGHRKWLNAATMLVRLNTAIAATRPAADGEPGFHPGALRARYDLDDAVEVVRFAGNLTLDGRIPSALKMELVRLEGAPDPLLARTLRILASSPEYQMA